MNKVFTYEFKSTLRRNSFLFSTLIIMVIIFALSFVPRFTGGNESLLDGINKNATIDIQKLDFSDSMIYIDDKKIDEKYLQTLMGITKTHIARSEEDLKEKVESGIVDRGYIVKSDHEYKVLVKDKKYFSNNTKDFSSILSKYIFDNNLMDLGINPGVVEGATRENIQAEEIILGRDLSKNFILAIIYILILYLLILFYGSNISNSVAKEKSDRTMELLITSTRPYALVLGKVFSSGVLGLIQFIIFVATGILGIFFNRRYYPEGIFEFMKNLFSVEFALIFLTFIILGYILYLFIFAASGAKVRRMEDINMVTLPVVFIFILILVMTFRGILYPEGMLMKVLSFVPFSSPMAMPVRYSLATIPVEEVLISLGILLITVIITAIVSISLYRKATRTYGGGY